MPHRRQAGSVKKKGGPVLLVWCGGDCSGLGWLRWLRGLSRCGGLGDGRVGCGRGLGRCCATSSHEYQGNAYH